MDGETSEGHGWTVGAGGETATHSVLLAVGTSEREVILPALVIL